MQWHRLDHMQTICTLLQTDNHINTPSLNFWHCCPTNSVKALKLYTQLLMHCKHQYSGEWTRHPKLELCGMGRLWLGYSRDIWPAKNHLTNPESSFKTSELCEPVFRQIVHDESHVLHYLLSAKHHSLLTTDCDQQRHFHYSTRRLLVTEIPFRYLC